MCKTLWLATDDSASAPALTCSRSLEDERESEERSSIRRRSAADSFRQGTSLLSSLVSHLRSHDHDNSRAMSKTKQDDAKGGSREEVAGTKKAEVCKGCTWLLRV